MNTRRYPKFLAGLVTSLILFSLVINPALAGVGDTMRVSLASDGTQGNGGSGYPSISTDGRYVAFYSGASNLVSGDTNNKGDVFVHDQQSGQTERVSVASDGTQGIGDSLDPSISADGRYVAFSSWANNLVSGDTNIKPDVFVYDRQSEQTTRVSVTSDGTQGNGYSERPSISADGRYVAFDSIASNLVSGDTNGGRDVFVYDRQIGQTERVSVASDGTQASNASSSWYPSISADGRYVAFDSIASNLVSGDTGHEDVFVHDLQSGQTERVSVASDGTQGNDDSWYPSISADGRYVAFYSGASNLVSGDTNGSGDVFVHDRQSGQTERISLASDGTQGNNWSTDPFISADGRYVAFFSEASNLVSGDTNTYYDVFVRDRQSGLTERVSVASDGTQGNYYSRDPSISADGRYVAFESDASNLVSGDTKNNIANNIVDSFVLGLQTINPFIQKARLTASDFSMWDGLGFSVAISGDTVAAGAYEADTSISRSSGAVYIFDKPSNGWNGNLTQIAKLVASDGVSGEWFGSSVAIYGDTVVVGAPLDYRGGLGVGAAYVFVKPIGGWATCPLVNGIHECEETAKLTASYQENGDNFGYSVAMYNEVIVVGDPRQHSGLPNVPGAAYVFVKPIGGWTNMTQTAKLTPIDGTPADLFGISVAISGDTIVVGANYADLADLTNAGAAYIFVKPVNGWAYITQTAKLTASDASGIDGGCQPNGDNFGRSVFIDNNTIAVGAPTASPEGLRCAGKAYVFIRPESGWGGELTETAKLIPSDKADRDAFGWSITVSNNTVLVGAYYKDLPGKPHAGAAYVFVRPATSWSDLNETSKLIASDNRSGDQFGLSVAIDGATAVVGADWGGDAYGAGAAYIFENPRPFLDLPLQYNNNFSLSANGNYGGNSPGLVNSWFDHNTVRQTVTTWTGNTYTGAAATSPDTCNRESCYDGHNGIDFRNTQSNEYVYAAANGTVFGVVNNCGGCTTGYGNRVWINHGNGYATLYGHLSVVSVTNGTVITDRITQPLGIMGSTGYSYGTHLHFGVYFDQNGDGQWSEGEAVDPYGLQGVSYLWIHLLSAQQQIDSSGGSASTPSGNSSVTVPAGAVSDPITLELWDTPPIAGASATLRSTGNSFWMRVLEWLTGGSSASLMASTSTNSFDVPVTITVHYDPSWVLHLDTNLLTIRQWDDVGQAWVALSTTLDTVNQQATAETSQPGHFDLQAPLVCPADTLEPNDNYDGASLVQTDGTLLSNLFDIAQDEDWFKFDAVAEVKYAIQTTNLAAGVDTALEIFDTDGVTVLASDDNGGGGKASRLVWQAPQSGTYFLRVNQAAGSAYGCSATYQISANQVYSVFLPMILR